MPTLIESTGTVSLYYNPNTNGGVGGSYSVVDNGVTTTIKDYGTIAPTFSASDIVAADYFNGYRVVVFNGGHTWYVDANWQKATVGPNGVDTTTLSNAQIAVLGTGPIVNPFYTFETTTPTITEGQTATLDVVTTNVAVGTVINYALMGVVGSDIVGGSLTGSTVVNSAGRAVINIPTIATPQVGTKNVSVSLSVSGNWVSSPITIVDAVSNNPVTRTLVESTGQISLYRNSDGSYSAQEGGVYIPIKDYGSAGSGFIGGEIAAADIVNGVRIVAFTGGLAWYADSNWRKSPLGPNGADSTQLSSGQIAALGTNANLTPTYSFSVPNSTIKEGQTATFILSTTNLAPGTSITYALLGVSAGDVGGGKLTDSVTIDGAGRATITVPTEITPQISNKMLSVSLSVSGNWTSSPVTITDLLTTSPQVKTLIESVGKVALYYNPNTNGGVGGSYSVVDNGVTTTIKDYGTIAPTFSASDIVAADYFNGYRVVVFNGGHTWYVDANWQKAPVGPNGVDTTQLSAEQIAVLGTGTIVNPLYSFTTLTPSITEGQTATFNLSTTNVATGTQITYALMGVIGSDIVGGSLTGSVIVDTAGRAVINIPTVANTHAGNKNLSVSLSVSGNWVSGTVNLSDNTILAPVSKTLVESNGAVALYSNSDGTFSASENGVLATIKDYGTPPTPFHTSGIVAAEYVNGVRAVVFSTGLAWYVDSFWQKAKVGPGGVDSVQLSTTQMAALLGNSQPVTKTLVEGVGKVSLYSNSDGTFSASENGVLTAIKDYGNPPTPTHISNIVAADYLNGYRVVTFFGGHTWYVDSNWQKAPVGPNGADTTQLTTDQVSTMIGGGVVTNPVIVRSLVSSSGPVSLFSDSNGTFSVLENGLYSFVKDFSSNTPTHAAISGAAYYNGARIVVLAGGADSANFWYVDSSWSKAPVGPAGASEGILSAAQLASVFPATNTKVMPTYNVAASSPYVNEGQVASFDLSTTNLAVGTKIDYALLGVTASDIVGGKLAGSVVVDASGHAMISVPTVANTHAGNKNLAVSLSVSGNVISSSILLKDAGAVASAPALVINTAVVAKTIGDVQVSLNGTSALLKDASGTAVTGVLDNVQRIKFSDVVLALDINGTAGQGYRLYKAAFDRAPDATGLGYWISALDQGNVNTKDVAQGFLNSPEFIKLYGANSADSAFISKLYQFVLHRTPDAQGYKYWGDILSASPTARADVLSFFSNSGENIDQVASLVANGIQYKEFVAT